MNRNCLNVSARHKLVIIIILLLLLSCGYLLREIITATLRTYCDYNCTKLLISAKTICTILLPVNTLFFISDPSYCALLLLEEDPLIFSDISTTSNLVPSSKHPSNELTFFPATILQYSLSVLLIAANFRQNPLGKCCKDPPFPFGLTELASTYIHL